MSLFAIKKKIKYSSYNSGDTKDYIKCLMDTGLDIPSDLYPHVLLAHKDILHIERGYADGLIWHRDLYEGDEYWYMPVGSCADYKKVFERYVPRGTDFAAIPEDLMKKLKAQLGDKFYFEHRRELDDYILDNNELVAMKGSRYKGLRSHVNKINREHSIELLDLSEADIPAVKAFNNKMLAEKDSSNVGIIHEGKVCDYLLSALGMDDKLFGTVLRIDGRIAGFTINEKGLKDECIGIYMKTDHDIKGLGQYLTVLDARKQLEKGIRFCNIMADEGEEKLRINKMGLRPYKIIKKYYGRYN